MARKRTEPQSRRPKSDVSGLTPGRAPAPDEIKLNAISAERLASLAGLEAQEIQGQTIASISEKLKWAIDPEWLFFPGHLRSALLSAGGCGVTPAELSGNPAVTQHWYENEHDNSWSTTAIYTVPADAPPGCYSFSFDTTSRAFNPAGCDGGYAADWNYDNPWPLESNPSVSVAVVGP